MRPPLNKLLISIDKKFYDSVAFASGQIIHFDPSWHPEEYTMMKARVVAVPDGIIKRHDYRGYSLSGIEPGDDILIRYDVIFAYKDQPENNTPIYKNLLFDYNGNTSRFEELWLCDILQVFGVYRGDHLEMLNGFVMLDPLEEMIPPAINGIIIPENYRTVITKYKGVVRYINSNLPVAPGDQVIINPNMGMTYQINLDKFYIIKQQYLLAKIN